MNPVARRTPSGESGVSVNHDAFEEPPTAAGMRSLKSSLIARARRKHGAIRPCSGCANIEECFAVQGDELFLWYNDRAIDSTHLERARISLPRGR